MSRSIWLEYKLLEGNTTILFSEATILFSEEEAIRLWPHKAGRGDDGPSTLILIEMTSKFCDSHRASTITYNI